MMQKIIIIDDFLEHAQQLRDIGLAQEYPTPEGETYFPGRNSKHAQRINGMTERISKIVGEPLVPADGSSHSKFRLALEQDDGSASVHIDDAHWSAMLYLSKDEDCASGTEFYRHIPTGSDHAPLSADDFSKMGLKDAQQMWDEILLPHTNDKSKWQHLMTVPMRFNRLLLFRPQQWHDAGPGFGDSPENGRLIYTMFFKSAG